jgi:hypothetical protein
MVFFPQYSKVDCTDHTHLETDQGEKGLRAEERTNVSSVDTQNEDVDILSDEDKGKGRRAHKQEPNLEDPFKIADFVAQRRHEWLQESGRKTEYRLPFQSTIVF